MAEITGGPRESPKGHRSLQLDFLRGVAILLVLAIHFDLAIPDVPFLGPFFEFFRKIGWVGVDLFFVLSGFLVGGLLIMELDKYGTVDAKRFLIRRGLKIYPLYYVFFGYLFAMPMFKAIMKGEAIGAVFTELWSKYWPNLLFLNGYLGVNPIGHTWTLAIEEHFYIILPFLILLLGSRLGIRQITVICAAVLIPVISYRCHAILVLGQHIGPIKETHLRIDSLFFGVAIRGFANAWPHLFARLGRYRYPLVLVGSGLMAMVPYMRYDLMLSVGYAITTLAAGMVLVGTFSMRSSEITIMRPVALCAIRIVSWIGMFSYSIYIWHPTFFRILGRVSEKLGYSSGAPNAMLFWLASAVVTSVVTILISAAISRLVEIPILKFRDRFFPSRSRSIPVGHGAPE